jgi:hypothetical protein
LSIEASGWINSPDHASGSDREQRRDTDHESITRDLVSRYTHSSQPVDSRASRGSVRDGHRQAVEPPDLRGLRRLSPVLHRRSASQANTGAPSFWSDAAFRRRLAVTPDFLGVGTGVYGQVPVVVDIADTPPGADLGDWEHVVEASIRLPTGRLVIDGCTAWRPNQSPSQPPPGVYGIYYGNIAGGASWDEHRNTQMCSGRRPTRAEVLREIVTVDAAARHNSGE